MTSIFTYLKEQIVKFFKGAKLALIGLQAYYYYPKLMVFPFIEGLLTTLISMFIVSMILVTYGISSYIMEFKEYSEVTMKIILAVGFVLGICLSSFIHVLSRVGICYATAACCENSSLGFWASLRISLKKWKNIILWGAIYIISKIFSGRKREPNTPNTMWSIITSTAWALITFFIYPVMAFESLSLFQTIKKSISTAKDNFTTMTGINASLSVLRLLLTIIGFTLALIIPTLMLLITKPYHHQTLADSNATEFVIFTSSIFFSIASFLFVIFETVAFIHMAETIVSVIVYRHINHQPTGVFHYELLETILQETKAENTIPENNA